ncbi:MAG: hypothetical protein GY757_31050 [bacterium]|nr:hypothetical protein [bacterium]
MSKRTWKIIRYSALLVVLLVSIKAILFTWTLIKADYYYRGTKQERDYYLYKCVTLKPSVYHVFSKINQRTIDDVIARKVIYGKYRDKKNIFAELTGTEELTQKQFSEKYRHNLYFQYLFPGTGHGNWRNLDTVALGILADQSMNRLTEDIIKQFKPLFPVDFTENLIDYCRWQENHSLADFLLSTTVTKNKHRKIEKGPDYRDSLKLHHVLLKEKYGIVTEVLAENLVKKPGFRLSGEEFRQGWGFSKMAGRKPFSEGSFIIGPDKTSGNACLRIMGFYTGNVKEKSQARGGALLYGRIMLRKSFYIISFDYLTKTGKENASFFPGNKNKEYYLPPTNGSWHKAHLILENKNGGRGFFRPLFRMWGTGTMLVDNLVIAPLPKIIPQPGKLLIEKWQ